MPSLGCIVDCDGRIFLLSVCWKLQLRLLSVNKMIIFVRLLTWRTGALFIQKNNPEA